jgi:hypothetical protein
MSPSHYITSLLNHAMPIPYTPALSSVLFISTIYDPHDSLLLNSPCTLLHFFLPPYVLSSQVLYIESSSDTSSHSNYLPARIHIPFILSLLSTLIL